MLKAGNLCTKRKETQMFSLSRRTDSTSLWIELVDTTLQDKETTYDLYRQIETFLVKEYIDKFGQELLSKIDLNSLEQSLPNAVSKALIDRLFQGDKNV